MKSFSLHLPEAQPPVAAVFGSSLRAREQAKRNPEFVYLRFDLVCPMLSDGCRRRLEGWGVSCLSGGEDFVAYGIAEKEEDLLDIFAADPEVVSVDFQEPSAGK